MGIIGIAVFTLLIIAGIFRPKSRIVTALIFLFIWIIVGFNTYTPDYATYKFVYDQVSIGNGLNEFEPLFTFLMLICGKLGLSFQVFRIVFAFIYAIVALVAAKKLTNKKNKNTVLALFMLWPLIPNVSGMRIALSSIVLCCFVPYLAKDKRKATVMYVLGVIIATLIHMSSIFYIILVFAKKKMTTLKQLGLFAIVAIAILVLNSNILLIIIPKLFHGVIARKLTMWLAPSADVGFQRNSIFGFMAYSLFVIAFTVLVCSMSKCILRSYRNEQTVSPYDIKRITLYRNISYCLLLVIPGFVIAGIYERYLLGVLPVYYSVFSEFRIRKRMIKPDYRILYSVCFIMLILAEIAFYIYSNTYVSNNFNLLDVFKNNLLVGN